METETANDFPSNTTKDTMDGSVVDLPPLPRPRSVPTRTALARAQRALKGAHDESHRLQSKKNNIQSKLENLNTRHREQTELRTTLDLELAKLSEDLNAAKERTTKLEQQLAANVKLDSQRKVALEQLEKAALEKEAERDALRTEVALLRSKAKDAATNSERISRELERDHARHMAQQEVLNLRNEQARDLELQLAGTKQSILVQSEAYDSAGTALERCKNNQVVEFEESKIARMRLKLVRNEGGTLKAALEDVEKEVVSARHQHEDLETTRALATSELDELKMRVKKQEESLAQLAADVGDAAAEVEEKRSRFRTCELDIAAAVKSAAELESSCARAREHLEDSEFARDRLEEHLGDVHRVHSVAVEEERRLRALLSVVGGAPQEAKISQEIKADGPGKASLDRGMTLKDQLYKKIEEFERLKTENAKLTERLETNEKAVDKDCKGFARPLHYLGGNDRPIEGLRKDIDVMNRRLRDLRRDQQRASRTTSPPTPSAPPVQRKGTADIRTQRGQPNAEEGKPSARDMALIAELSLPDDI